MRTKKRKLRKFGAFFSAWDFALFAYPSVCGSHRCCNPFDQLKTKHYLGSALSIVIIAPILYKTLNIIKHLS